MLPMAVSAKECTFSIDNLSPRFGDFMINACIEVATVTGKRQRSAPQGTFQYQMRGREEESHYFSWRL